MANRGGTGAGTILIGLGANRAGAWGEPRATLERAFEALHGAGVRVRAVSPLYETAPLGPAAQAPYVNAVALVESALPPRALLMRLKCLEKRAGRRAGRPWGPRALDLDILDYKGRVLHWRGRRPARAGGRAGLALPHPGLHRRPFVLRPLIDVCPRWRHPVLRLGAAALLRRVTRVGAGVGPGVGPGRILRRLS